MQFNRCFGCMKEIKGYPCPHCGFDPRANSASNYVLPYGYFLNGHYVVGKVLGQGGFGITYIGFDLNLGLKVAIKEYFPSGQVSRFAAMGPALQWRDGEQAEKLRVAGMESFLREARKMAKVDGIPEIVRVRESFLENNTAYIVMDYMEGRTLLSVLKEKGPMPWEQARDIFLPAISAMEKVHQAGLVHRDLSPDNLMLTDKGVRILDLGAAKDLSSSNGASSAQVAKGGFSPLEQYTQRGGSGPWSDVYAMAATIYYTLTGVLPPNAIDRMEQDSIDWKLLSQRGVPSGIISALQKAMNVTVKGRTQSMAELLRQLEKCRVKKKSSAVSPTDTIIPTEQKPVKEPKPVKEAKPAKAPKPEKPRKPPVKKTEGRNTGTVWISAAAAVVVVLGIALGFAVNAKKEPAAPAMALPPETQAVETTTPQEPTVPETTLPPETQPVPVHVMAATSENFWRLNPQERKNRPFWGQTAYKRADVKTVTFRGSLDGVPDNAWDVSEAGDRSILAWMEGGDLYVAADGKIAPNPDASLMFAFFKNATAIDFGGCFDTSNVASMGFMFYDCSSLTELDVSCFDTSNVTHMKTMFANCVNLTGLDVSGFDTSNVADMSEMFSGCSSLTELDVSGFDTANVYDMGGMFSVCSSLTELDVSGFDTANVYDMGGMFSVCSSLTELDLSGFDTSHVTDMGWMFQSCSSLTALDVSGFDTANVTDMSFMFRDCSSLTELDLSGFDTAKVINMYEMFSGCSSLTGLDVSGFDTAKVTNMYGTFSGCSSLTELDLSGFDTSKVTNMNSMFQNCSSLTELDLSGFDTAKVYDMGGMFSGCSSLKSLDLSNWNANKVSDMANMFKGCGQLTDFTCSDTRIQSAYKWR